MTILYLKSNCVFEVSIQSLSDVESLRFSERNLGVSGEGFVKALKSALCEPLKVDLTFLGLETSEN